MSRTAYRDTILSAPIGRSAPGLLPVSLTARCLSCRVRRRPAAGEYQLTFRHHSDPTEYERDYLTQVTHARCRASNPSAALLATVLRHSM